MVHRETNTITGTTPTMRGRSRRTRYQRCVLMTVLLFKSLLAENYSSIATYFLSDKPLAKSKTFRKYIVLASVCVLTKVKEALSWENCSGNCHYLLFLFQFSTSYGAEDYPTLGCDIQGFGAMGLSVQYWPRWFHDFPAIWLAVPFGVNGAHLGICTLPEKNLYLCEISCFWVK